MSKNTWETHVYRIGNEDNLDVQDPDESKCIELQGWGLGIMGTVPNSARA